MEAAIPERSASSWAAAVMVSVVVHLVLALSLVKWDDWRREKFPGKMPVEKKEVVVELTPDMIRVEVVPMEGTPELEPPSLDRSFVRTSANQEAERSGTAAYIGERSTRAASETEVAKEGPMLPSQDGVDPDERKRVELTESQYEDGELERNPGEAGSSSPSAGAPESAAMTEEAREAVEGAEQGHPEAVAQVENPVEGGQDEATREGDPASALAQDAPGGTKKDRLMEGPDPVDVEVPETRPAEESRPPSREEKAETAKRQEERLKEKPAGASATSGDNGFSGFQERTRIQGTISRKGIRASLEVEGTVLGKYQAQVSRAIEREWRLNCARQRDYITPGVLSVRFVINDQGKVTYVGFGDYFGVGEIQKSFTLSSIKDAKMPEMPAELKKQLKGESLESVYNFIFE